MNVMKQSPMQARHCRQQVSVLVVVDSCNVICVHKWLGFGLVLACDGICCILVCFFSIFILYVFLCTFLIIVAN